MVNRIDKNNATIYKNLKLFFSSASSLFSDHKDHLHTNLLTANYIQEVLLSLICHLKLARNSTNKFWVYDDFIYRTLLDFINNDMFLNKIAEIKEYHKILGSQFLKFDPLFQNIIFLPLKQQKIIYESAITQVIDSSDQKNLMLFDTTGNSSFDHYQRFPNHFENALLIVLFQRLETTINFLNIIVKSSGSNLKYFSSANNNSVLSST